MYTVTDNASILVVDDQEVNRDLLLTAALLHDIGRRYETREQGKICHAEKGAELPGSNCAVRLGESAAITAQRSKRK